MSIKTEPGSDREIRLSRLLNAPISLVWEVWTNPDHIKNWWGPNGFTNTITKMDITENGEWYLVMHGPDGTNYKNKSIFKEVVKHKRLVYEHVSVPTFLATIEFEEQGEKTLLNWHMLFESKEQFIQVVKTFKADEGIKQNGEKLEQYLQIQLKNQKNMEATPFIIERTYNAPVEKVWKAITDKNEMKQWYFDLAEFKPEVGFEFQFAGQGSKGESYVHHCKITTVIPGKKLSYSWQYEGLPGYSLVTFELFPEGDKTRLLLTHEGLETFPGATNPDFSKESFSKGWNQIIGTNLADFVEKN